MSIAREAGGSELKVAPGRDRGLLLAPAAGDFVFLVRKGLVAVEVVAADGGSRVCDYICPDEAISSGMLRGFERVRLRAIEPATLLRQTHAAFVASIPPADLARIFESAAARLMVMGAILALDDLDARVASFVVMLALRYAGRAGRPDRFALAMPREDVADFVLINPDTLSRIYSRFRAAGVLERGRLNQMTIRDWPGLVAQSPIAGLISASFTVDDRALTQA